MSQRWISLISFFVLNFVLRFSTLFASATDRDEGIYFLIAQSFLAGHPPYVEVWENKPPGIFFLFATAILIFGNSPIAMRLLAIICTTFTSYFLWGIGKTLDEKHGEKIGLVAGLVYAVFSLHNDGNASNAEIIFAPFVTLAFLLFFRGIQRQLSPMRGLLIGLSLGLALQIKYVVIMDIIALAVLAGVWFLKTAINRGFSRQQLRQFFLDSALKFYLTFTLGLILPLTIILIYYWQVNHLSDYFYATLTANQKYVQFTEFEPESLLNRLRKQVNENLMLWILLFTGVGYIIIPKRWIQFSKKPLFQLLIWFCITFVAVLISKRFYNHYFLQLLPPLCLITGYLLVQLTYWEPIKNLQRRTLILALILLYPVGQSIYNRSQKSWEFISNEWIKGIDNWDDREEKIADYLKPRIAPDDYIYVVNHQPILYALVPAKIPTKYPFPSHLTALSHILPIDPITELQSIMRRRPVYVILANKDNINPNYREVLNLYLENRYFLETEIENIKLYRIGNRE